MNWVEGSAVGTLNGASQVWYDHTRIYYLPAMGAEVTSLPTAPRRSRNEIERDGTQAALARCRALALQIQSELSRKKVDDFVDLMALADFQVSIERAAFVLERSKVEN